MSKRQFITYTTTSQTMGDATEDDAGLYAAALQTELEALYPEHDISVKVNSHNSRSLVDHSNDIEEGEIEGIAQNLWDRGDWYTA